MTTIATSNGTTATSNGHQPFQPNKHLMKIKQGESAADYLPVQWRLVWFREQCPDGQITTELVHLDLDRETSEEGWKWDDALRKKVKVTRTANGYCVFKAIVNDGKGGIATAHKSEKAASFPDFMEKCETGAVGRALAMLGYGTQFTGEELSENHRIVDSPVKR